MHSRLPQPRRVNSPNPALVTQRAARSACRAWRCCCCAPPTCCPGCSAATRGRAPTSPRSATCVSIAQGQHAPGWRRRWAACRPTRALLPYWLGAAVHQAARPVARPGAGGAHSVRAAARAACSSLTWYSAYHLARTEAAQPLPFAFGGEAEPVDYARAIADGALLALIASLGLLQLGHETTPELVQLAAVALYLYALAARAASALTARAGSRCWRRCRAGGERRAEHRRCCSASPAWSPAVRSRRRPASARLALAGSLGALLLARAAGDRRSAPGPGASVASASLAQVGSACCGCSLWFTWPAWLLALWTLWRWRRQLREPAHRRARSAAPPSGLLACVAMGGSRPRADARAAGARRARGLRAADAAAQRRPRRSTGSRCSSSAVCALDRAGSSTSRCRPACRPSRPPTSPGSRPAMRAPSRRWRWRLALLGTLAWLWLVRWRTGRHRHPLWKSLVLPAGGVALCWLLVMTLMLPLLDYARSYRVQIERIARHVPRGACVVTVACRDRNWRHCSISATIAPMPRLRRRRRTATTCSCSSRGNRPRGSWPGWEWVATERRPTDRDEATAIFRRDATGG